MRGRDRVCSISAITYLLTAYLINWSVMLINLRLLLMDGKTSLMLMAALNMVVTESIPCRWEEGRRKRQRWHW